MTLAKRTAASFVFSFIVYLTPLVGPHAAFFLGDVVWRDLRNVFQRQGDRTFAWIATDVGVAILAQLTVFIVIYWLLTRLGLLRSLCVAITMVLAVVALNFSYMIAIPTLFLVEADNLPERVAWPLECTAKDVWIPQIAAPPNVALPAPIWTADVNPPNHYALFNPVGCTVAKLELAQTAMGYVTFVAGDVALYMSMSPTGQPSFSVFDAATNKKHPIEVGSGQSVILSNDGRSAAWLRPVSASTPPISLEVVILREGRPEVVVGLGALGGGGLQQLIQFDSEAGELLLVRGLSELMWVGTDGRVRRTLTKPEGVEPQPQTYRLLSNGWVAWDAYRENRPYRVAWSLPDGTGNHQVPKGRGITSLGVSPDGNWIALSVTSSVSIGSTLDAVSVLRVADGTEVFRKYLPRYTRSIVAFPDARRFIYTDLEGLHVRRIIP